MTCPWCSSTIVGPAEKAEDGTSVCPACKVEDFVDQKVREIRGTNR